MAEKWLATLSASVTHVGDLLLSLLYVSGVYVPPGAGIGPGGTGPGTGFFPGNRASNDCLDSLDQNISEDSNSKQSLFVFGRGTK